MRRSAWIVVALVVWSAAIACDEQAIGSQPAQVPAGQIEIDGSKSPESIPEWLAWHSSLDTLANFANVPDSAPLAIVGGDEPADRETIMAFALAEAGRWEECRDRQIALLGRENELGRVATQVQIEEDQIQCREAMLAAKDAFLKTLNSIRASAFQAFVDNGRKGISVHVSRASLEQFRRPR